MEPAAGRKNLTPLLVGLIAAGTLLRIGICFYFNPLDFLFSDPQRHWLNGRRFLTPNLMRAGDPILYQVYLFLLQHVTGENRFLIALSAALLSAVMPWTYYRAGREFGLSKNAALTAWALIAWMPSLAWIHHYFMAETLILPLIGLSLWMSARHLRKQTSGSFLWAAGCWTAASLGKPNVVPLAGVCLVYGWWQAPFRMRNALAALALIGGLLAPGAIRSYHGLGFPAPLGNPWVGRISHASGARVGEYWCGQAHWSFSSPSCYIQPLYPLSSWMLRRANEDSVVSVRINPSRGAQDWKEAYDSLPRTWSGRLLHLWENFILFLFGPSWPDSMLTEWGGWLNYWARWLWAPLIFVLFEQNLGEFRQKKFHLIPIAVTVFTLFLAFQNTVLMEGRYRKPLEPLLLLNLVLAQSTPRAGAAASRDGSDRAGAVA